MNSLTRLLYKLNRLRWRITRPVTLGVRLVLVQDGTVLLIKHTYQPRWYLPGGGVKRHETLEDAARREAHEEVGATLDELSLFGVYSNFYEYKSDHVIVFLCESFTLTETSSIEIEQCQFFELTHLPDDISPGSRHRVEEYVAQVSRPIVAVW